MKKLDPSTEEHPWGSFRLFVKNIPSTVKILFVKKGETLSLQKHFHRSEFWRVLRGNPEIIIGDKTIKSKVGDEFEVNQEENHRISAPEGDIEILEISLGDFDEEDIVRTKDKYGRA